MAYSITTNMTQEDPKNNTSIYRWYRSLRPCRVEVRRSPSRRGKRGESFRRRRHNLLGLIVLMTKGASYRCASTGRLSTSWIQVRTTMRLRFVWKPYFAFKPHIVKEMPSFTAIEVSWVLATIHSLQTSTYAMVRSFTNLSIGGKTWRRIPKTCVRTYYVAARLASFKNKNEPLPDHEIESEARQNGVLYRERGQEVHPSMGVRRLGNNSV